MSLRFLTAGESHGRGLTGILEGIPSGLDVTVEMLHTQLQRRKLGFGRGARQKIETDEVEILSGVRFGKTLGSPVCLLIWNKDWQAWKEIMRAEPLPSTEQKSPRPSREVTVPRPGHADLIGGIKYDHRDMRNVLERSSARETAIRVALGAVARQFLAELGIKIGSRVTRIGSVLDRSEVRVPIEDLNSHTDLSPVRCLDPASAAQMVSEIEKVKKEGDTLGGEFEVYVSNLPIGLGSYVHWDRRVEGKIAQAFLSLNAIKGVEVGAGFRAASQRGSEVHDEFYPGQKEASVRFATNYSGGIDGGMTTGQPLVIRAGMKPLSTLMSPLQSVNLLTGKSEQAHVERSDICAVPAAAVIGESLAALVLGDLILEKFGGDSMKEVSYRVREWKQTCRVEVSSEESSVLPSIESQDSGSNGLP